MSEEDIGAEEEQPGAILFELENVSVEGRDVMYQVIAKILEAKGITIKPFTFSRYALNVSLAQFVETIVEVNKKRFDVDKLVKEIEDKCGQAILKKVGSMNKDLAKLIKQAGEKSVQVGALSVLEQATAKEFIDKIGLSDLDENILCSKQSGRCCHSADAWLKLAKNMDVPPAKCLVIATCRVSCKSALKAGMRCIVIPDKFTSFQDFGGADMVVEALSADVQKQAFELLEND